MKVLFYISTIRGGGAGRVMSNIANYMAEHNHEIIFVVNFPSDTDYALHKEIKRIDIDDREYAHNALVSNPVRIAALRKIIKSNKPDLCVGFMGENNIRLLLANAFLKSKTLISVRNDPNMEYRHAHIRFFARMLYPFSDGIVFQTEDAQKWFSQKIQSKSRIIMNPVDDVFFNTQLEEDRKNIVAIGRLSKQKNLSMLIKAFARIEGQTDDDVLVYGSGSLQGELQQEIDESGMHGRIRLMGATSDVPYVLKRAKVFVMTSDYEGMPNALQEALAMGLPCISTDCPCGGPRMLIKNGDNGILIPVNDDRTLSEVLTELLTNKDELKQLGKRAKKDSNKFRTRTIMNQWMLYMETIIQ